MLPPYSSFWTIQAVPSGSTATRTPWNPAPADYPYQTEGITGAFSLETGNQPEVSSAKCGVLHTLISKPLMRTV